MLRAYIVVLAVLLAASACEGAVLLRFINTVPTRLSTNPNGPTPAPTATGHVGAPSWTQDRVGLQYFADSTTSGNTAQQSATIVWTELLNQNANEGLAVYSPHAWSHGMPALRAYHSTLNPTTGLVDRVAAYLNTQIPTADPANPLRPYSDDNYEQTFLKADGVSLYLSFAPGTYRMQAYGVLGSLADPLVLPYANTIRPFTDSVSVFTFEDNKVYTLVALGDGRFSATPVPITGNTVRLRLFEESTAPATFGMASLRWFHAIKSYSTDTISVFRGDSTSAPALASGIAFGALSDYVDVKPNSAQLFPITTSSTGSTVVAPVSSDRNEVTHDVRAGLRATIVCAVNNDVDNRVFCRMIPSRVVAYVRLVNDLAGLNGLTQGRFGSQQYNRVNLTLWASYEFPRPDQVVELSQTGGSRSVNNHPANMRGLYGVVSNVGSNDCSGYGEVFVPLLIMDFAVRFTIIRDSAIDNVDGTAAAAVGGYTRTGTPVPAASNSNQLRPADAGANNQWFIGAPVFKRVNFIVKTDGMATLSGTIRPVAGATTPVRVYGANLADWFTTALLLDEYMEPGAYYTLFVAPTAGVAANTLVTPDDIRFFWRLDRTIDVVSSGVPDGKATIGFIPFAEQTWDIGRVTLRPKTTTNGNQIATLPAVGTAARLASVAGAYALNGDIAEWVTTSLALTANTGSYSFDFTGTVANPCINQIPGSTDVTFNSGDIIDVYVLNSFGCLGNSNDANRLKVAICKTVSATTTGHAVGTLLNGVAVSTPPTFFFAAAPAISASVSLVIAAIFAAVAALL